MRTILRQLVLAVLVFHGFAASTLSSPAPGAATEIDLMMQVVSGTLGNCLMTNAKIRGVDVCTYDTPLGPIPMVCTRMEMAVPMAIVEGTDQQGLLGYAGVDLMGDMAARNMGMTPLERRNPQRGGGDGGGSGAGGTTQGHIANLPLIIRAGYNGFLMLYVSALQACTPAYSFTAMPFGYAFASESDHVNNSPTGNWRGVVSRYWYIPWETPLTTLATSMDIFGFCAADYFRIFCYGNTGVRYPATGTNSVESRGLNMLDAAYDGFNVTTAPFGFYGPLHVTPGAGMNFACHDIRSYVLGLTALHSTFQRGGLVQSIYPVRNKACTGTTTPATDLIPGLMDAHMPQVASKATAEANQQAVQDRNRAITALLWPRFTCCNYCIGSNEMPANHLIVGKGFLPQLISWSD